MITTKNKIIIITVSTIKNVIIIILWLQRDDILLKDVCDVDSSFNVDDFLREIVLKIIYQ